MSTPIQYFIVDAFTDRPFAGNPAAVVPLAHWPDDAWLQNVAQEMNLSETAYVVPNQQGFDLRWFTPKVEVELCGHATLAAAVVLSSIGELPNGATISFSTRSGILTARQIAERFQLDFPVKPAEECAAPPGLVEALRIVPKYIGRNSFDYLIEAESESTVRAISPDFKCLATIECRGVIITARCDYPSFDFVSRFFAPAAGVDEDPVTGSAHCCLADHWGKRIGKTKMIGRQVSRRGGVVYVELQGQRVLLGGDAVLVAQGELLAGCSNFDLPIVRKPVKG